MIAQTQQRIIDAAIIVFNEDFSAPLEKVAEQADVTRRTLHRYFKDRTQLLESCEADMQKRCTQAMQNALASSKDRKAQLQNMLFAGIDCGAKYSFFHKQHMREGHQHTSHDEDCAAFDSIEHQFTDLISSLKSDGEISDNVTIQWVKMFFASIVAATVNAKQSNNTQNNDMKDYAWFSLSNGIGLKQMKFK
jgi:AcrR family transcriptional regulator